MAKTENPVSSFGPELQQTLRAGANKEFRLKFDSPAIAIRFKQRIHQLRHAMKKAKHADWEQLYRCGVHQDIDDPSILIIGPKDSEFRAVLQKAGIDVAAPPESTHVTIESPPPGELSIDSLMAELKEATEVPKQATSFVGGQISGCTCPSEYLVPPHLDSCPLVKSEPEAPNNG